jgi:ferric-dicitrate binding protein FerR (iron transport regulator)
MKLPESDRSIERLIKLAGERDMPSPEAMERARNEARQSFQHMLEQRPAAPSRRRVLAVRWFAVAATLAAVVSYFSLQRPGQTPPARVANFATLQGELTLLESSREIPAQVGSPVHAGNTLTTRDGRVALTLGDALSLRVDRHTRLRFDGRERITLMDGSLYVDSGGVNTVPALRIDTPAGAVQHVGTQFQVTVAGDTTRVRVREGRVFLTRETGVATDIASGDELSIQGRDLQWRRGLASFGPEWEWSASIATPLDIENRPLSEFLAWITREHGWQLRHADATLQQRTYEIRLHGSLKQLDAAAMLERVSMVTGVPLSAHDGVLSVGGARR